MEVIVMKNNTMKKLLTAALSLSLALSLAACSGGNSAATPAPADTEPVETIGGADGPTASIR